MSENRIIDFDDKTTIFDYFKDHHSLLIACVSGIVAVLSFYVSLLSYISSRIVLDEYAIHPELIQVNGQGNIFYKTIAAIVFYIALISIQYITKYYIHRNYVICAADMYCLIYYGTYSDKALKKEQRKTYHSTLLYIFPYIIVLALICILYALSNNSLSWSTLIFTVVILLFTIIGAYRSESKNKKRFSTTTIKNRVERIKNGMNDIDEGGICEDDKLMIKDIKEITETLSKQSIITNGSVVLSVMFIVIAMIFTFLSVVVNSTIEIKNQKKFPIYYEDDKAFAIVYQNEKYYVLEEIKINGDELIIYRKRQRYLSSDDITVEYMNFKNVTKMDLEEEKIETQTIGDESLVSEEMIGNDVENTQ